jgi:hypothetical protein
MRRVFPLLLLSLGMLLQSSPIPLRAVQLGKEGLLTVPVPPGIAAVQPLLQADLDGDGLPESLALTNGRLAILARGEAAWQSPLDWESPQSWQVRQAAVTDLDGDGQPEVTLLLWRPFRPWPVDQWLPDGGRIATFQDAAGQSCHLILIGWRGEAYREVWAGSAMADPMLAFAAADLDGDGAQELVALEGRYADTGLSQVTPKGRTLKLWEWNGFGFSVVSSMDGSFSKMTLVQASDGRLLILIP